jgi:hypothetical protein
VLVEGPVLRAVALAFPIVLVLAACQPDNPTVPRTDPVTNQTPSKDKSGNPADESSPSVVLPQAALDTALEAARAEFASSPPSLHGTYEYRSERETLTYELWIDWPAFRVYFTAKESAAPDSEPVQPLILATPDGKRFGVRDPLSGETYVTRSLGEAPWVIGPIVNFFGDPDPCARERVVGTEQILERTAIRVHCSKFETYDTWIDRESGLVLRQILWAPSEQEPGWSGFVELEWNPPLDRGLFDPGAV